MRYITGLCTLLLSVSLWSQPVEKYELLTDRQYYVAGEHLRFRVFDLSQFEEGEQFSKVYYLELVSPEGNSFVRSKALLEAEGTSGSIQIPLDLPSGNYYLKGYTRWMRNRGPGAYAYQQVRVINPYEKRILGSPGETPEAIRLEFQSQGSSPDKWLNCDLPEELSAGNLVEFRLSGKEGPGRISSCVSIALKGLVPDSHSLYPVEAVPGYEEKGYIAETRGVSISGKVIEEKLEEPVPYAAVYISGLGQVKDFRCNYTDSAGRFYFSLPEIEGEQQFFISSHKKNQDHATLILDQDFCQEALNLPFQELILDSSLIGLISGMSVNAQLAFQYALEAENEENESGLVSRGTFFYGEAPVIIAFDNFIRLPALEEYFSELTPQVSVIKEKGLREFRIHGSNPDLQFYDPLIMVDGVAIFDVEAVLGINPRLVDHFEIVDAPYVVGNVTFGGMLNVVTREGDLGRIDLPSSGLLLNYIMSSSEWIEGSEYQDDPRIPDLRNTLLWDSRLDLNSGEGKAYSFALPGKAGRYELLVRGFTPGGKYLEFRKEFHVR